MNITHVISSIDIASGGPSRSTTHLLSAMGNLFPNSKFNLHTHGSKDPIIRSFDETNVNISFYRLKALGRLRGLEQALCTSESSIYHGQGIWQLPVHQMAKLARQISKPYIITPRGMLDSWSLEQRKLKKEIALKLYQYNDLSKASCIHVTAEKEAGFVRSLGLKNPIAIIPNGIPLNDFKMKPHEEIIISKKILFLSRIHPKKGLELLIEAWSELPLELKKDWSIDIVGEGDRKYINRLKTLINTNKVSKDIHFKGSLDGEDKVKAYQNADIFILPTHTENFGIVIAEALACGTPVITTEGAPWRDLKTYNCGWWTKIGVVPLQEALSEAMNLPKNELITMGLKGHSLIKEKYSIRAVAISMHELYSWILGNSPKPDFVV